MKEEEKIRLQKTLLRHSFIFRTLWNIVLCSCFHNNSYSRTGQSLHKVVHNIIREEKNAQKHWKMGKTQCAKKFIKAQLTHSIWQHCIFFSNFLMRYVIYYSLFSKKDYLRMPMLLKIVIAQWYIFKRRILLPIWVHFWARILLLKVIYGLFEVCVLLLKVIYGLFGARILLWKYIRAKIGPSLRKVIYGILKCIPGRWSYPMFYYNFFSAT